VCVNGFINGTVGWGEDSEGWGVRAAAGVLNKIDIGG
jgi:hypothetical protein